MASTTVVQGQGQAHESTLAKDGNHMVSLSRTDVGAMRAVVSASDKVVVVEVMPVEVVVVWTQAR